MSNNPKPTPETIAQLEKSARDFLEGMQALAQLHPDDPAYEAARAKTAAAYEAQKAAIATFDPPSP